MPGRRATPPSPQVKEFRSLEEIGQAVTKIRRRIDDVRSLDAHTVRWNDQRVRNGQENIQTMLLEVFGPDSPEYKANGAYRFVSLTTVGNFPDSDCQAEFAKKIPQAVTMLENHLARLDEKRVDLGVDKTASVRTAFEGLDLHPRIAAVAADLYRGGNYRHAVLDASVALVNFVKEKSRRHDLDGSGLMSTVFSKNNPILAFNGLADQTDEDEQQGMMHLFMGVVLALRNPRAHALPDDSPEMALEYIGLISMLAKRLEEARRLSP
jgi:uncharacterized protein (TIGR02391 family)